jgi:hypothetical protein
VNSEEKTGCQGKEMEGREADEKGKEGDKKKRHVKTKHTSTCPKDDVLELPGLGNGSKKRASS